MNLLDGTLKNGAAILDAGGFTLPVSRIHGAEGARIRFGIRPENMVLDDSAPASGRVFDIENHGVIKILTLDVDGTHLHATVSAQTRVQIDEVIRFGWRPEKVLSFDPSNGRNLDLD